MLRKSSFLYRLDFQGLFVFLGVKSTPYSPLHLFLDLLDLNQRIYANILNLYGFCGIIKKKGGKNYEYTIYCRGMENSL